MSSSTSKSHRKSIVAKTESSKGPYNYQKEIKQLKKDLRLKDEKITLFMKDIKYKKETITLLQTGMATKDDQLQLKDKELISLEQNIKLLTEKADVFEKNNDELRSELAKQSKLASIAEKKKTVAEQNNMNLLQQLNSLAQNLNNLKNVNMALSSQLTASLSAQQHQQNMNMNMNMNTNYIMDNNNMNMNMMNMSNRQMSSPISVSPTGAMMPQPNATDEPKMDLIAQSKEEDPLIDSANDSKEEDYANEDKDKEETQAMTLPEAKPKRKKEKRSSVVAKTSSKKRKRESVPSVPVHAAQESFEYDDFGNAVVEKKKRKGKAIVSFDTYLGGLESGKLRITKGGRCLNMDYFSDSLYIISSNGFSSGKHEWEIKAIKTGDLADEIGICSSWGDLEVNGNGIADMGSEQLGARAVYANDPTTGVAFHDAYDENNKLTYDKKFKKKANQRSSEFVWSKGDVVKVALNLSKWYVKFYLNNKQVGKSIALTKDLTYYPILCAYGSCQYQVIACS